MIRKPPSGKPHLPIEMLFFSEPHWTSISLYPKCAVAQRSRTKELMSLCCHRKGGAYPDLRLNAWKIIISIFTRLLNAYRWSYKYPYNSISRRTTRTYKTFRTMRFPRRCGVVYFNVCIVWGSPYKQCESSWNQVVGTSTARTTQARRTDWPFHSFSPTGKAPSYPFAIRRCATNVEFPHWDFVSDGHNNRLE